MAVIYLALGSNIGDANDHLVQAIKLLATSVSDITAAPLYSSKAVGYTDQPDFLNTALRGVTSLSPEQLLSFVKSVEKQVGRIARFRWGPREIDIDIIFYDNLVQETEVLTIPHPRFAERDFVLKPISDIDPGLIDPKSQRGVSELLHSLPPDQTAILTRVDAEA